MDNGSASIQLQCLCGCVCVHQHSCTKTSQKPSEFADLTFPIRWLIFKSQRQAKCILLDTIYSCTSCSALISLHSLNWFISTIHDVFSVRCEINLCVLFRRDSRNVTAEAKVAGHSQRRSGINPWPFPVVSVVDKVALGQGFLRVLLFSPFIIIPRVIHTRLNINLIRRTGG
jgi:hypothetical protein